MTFLIGSDRPDINDNEVERRTGVKYQPYAVKTPLSWTVCGPMVESGSDEVDINFIRSGHEEMVSKQLECFFNTEFGEFGQSFSVEDQRAKKSTDESARLVEGHY